MKPLPMRLVTMALAVALAAAVLVPQAVLAADTDIVINEIMQNPSVLSDTVGEWFEVHNTGATDVDLEGWTIKDNDTDIHVITTGGSVIVPAGGYAVLARDAATMAGEGVTVLYQYSGITLANGADELVLLNASLVEIDRVEWDGGPVWPDPNGASMMFDEVSPDNNVGTAWAASTTPFGSGDFGTPGMANGGVPLQPPFITDVYHRPLLPVPDEMVTIQATVTDADGTITAVTLHYSYNGGAWQTQAMSVASGDTFTTTLQGGVDGDQLDYYVTATDNDAQTSSNPTDAPTSFYTYTVAPELITPIATIHADSAGYDGTLVMVEGQVYITGDYKADGTSVSAYIQDGSGRGLNVFGTTRSTGMALLNDTGNIVKVSGYVDYYFSTLEIVNYEVELVSSGNTPLSPAVMASTAAAAAPSNEGTYIQATGPITAIATTSGSNPAHNFTIDDGSGPVVVRIDDDVVVGLDTWLVGDELVAAGAGSTYNGQGQILVGSATDIVNNGQGPDTTPPTLTGATLTAPTTVLAGFSEAVDPVTAADTNNYQVYQTAAPANTIAVTAAVVQPNGSSVELTLAASASGVDHTLQVDNVQDLAGNPIAAGSTAAIIEVGNGDIVINEIMQNPFVLADADGEWFEVYNQGTGAVDMNGWTIKDADTDLHVIDNGGPLIIGAGEYKVFVRNATAMTAEGVTPFYQYAGITLGNASDELVLLDTSGAQVDSVAWDDGLTWPDPVGSSMQFVIPGDNNDGSHWAQNGPVFGSGDRGTPGGPNDYLSPAPLPVLETALRGNYPNPFNPRTVFDFSLKQDDHVLLQVFDVRGRRVRAVVDANLPAGDYGGLYAWDGKDDAGRAVTSGTYFFRLQTGSGFTDTGKMLLLK